MSDSKDAGHPQGYYYEDLTVGMQAEFSKTIRAEDIVKFSEVSGDDNPLHLDEDYAKTTRFKTRIAHGMLSAGFISAVLGTKLPGPGSIYVSQSLKFKAPVRIGDTVTAIATVKEINPKKPRVVLETLCWVEGKLVTEGEALVLVPKRK